MTRLGWPRGSPWGCTPGVTQMWPGWPPGSPQPGHWGWIGLKKLEKLEKPRASLNFTWKKLENVGKIGKPMCFPIFQMFSNFFQVKLREAIGFSNFSNFFKPIKPQWPGWGDPGGHLMLKCANSFSVLHVSVRTNIFLSKCMRFLNGVCQAGGRPSWILGGPKGGTRPVILSPKMTCWGTQGAARGPLT